MSLAAALVTEEEEQRERPASRPEDGTPCPGRPTSASR